MIFELFFTIKAPGIFILKNLVQDFEYGLILSSIELSIELFDVITLHHHKTGFT